MDIYSDFPSRLDWLDGWIIKLKGHRLSSLLAGASKSGSGAQHHGLCGQAGLREDLPPLPAPDQQGARKRLYPTRSDSDPFVSPRKNDLYQASVHVDLRALDGPVFFKFNQTIIGSHSDQNPRSIQRVAADRRSHQLRRTARKARCHPSGLLGSCTSLLRTCGRSRRGSCDTYLDRIDRLFYLERLARRWHVRPQTLRRLRQRHSQKTIDELFKMAHDYVAEELLLKTPMPKVVKYLLGHEEPLRECFKHVPSRIDNNLAKNALRPLKIGAKN